ncbi:MAG: hypothetical protein ACREGG_04280 [Candidatus Saccharimonadales bacterium]
MSSAYRYRKPVRRSRYAVFRRRLLAATIFVAAVGAIAYFVYSNDHNPAAKPVSTATTTTVAAPEETFTGPYFEFQDTGKWSFDKHDSTDNRFVYQKYNKNELQHELDIYVNQVPIPLNLAVPLVLPVRIVNDNSLDITNVSSACGAQYAPGELHKVKELVINGATLLCDPDSPSYDVVLSEINGNYQLKMVRPNGQPIQFVIIYKDLGLAPQPDSLLNVASSFKTL